MISTQGLSKRFGYRWVLKDVDLDAQAGEIVALLGPNGAGKSTLLRILATLSKPTLGECQIAGFSLPQQAAAARARIGFLAHQPLLYEDLSAEQNLAFYARLYRIKRPAARVTELLRLFDLHLRRQEPVRIFSRGMQQRLALARVLLHNPRVLLLDEPHSGLDRAALDVLDSLLRKLAKKGTTILFATHDLHRAQSLARKVYVLAEGRLVAPSDGRRRIPGSFSGVYSRALRAAQKGA
ncbi:MAG: heme ABC exporter ATP-binding protein CcmA [Chloroflexi bacterium]|nr:heme ABC exporter ATP-binding protein CcmA [Chloroflexota bacterium]